MHLFGAAHVAGGYLESDCDHLPVVCGPFQGRFLPAVVDSKQTQEERLRYHGQPLGRIINTSLRPSIRHRRLDVVSLWIMRSRYTAGEYLH